MRAGEGSAYIYRSEGSEEERDEGEPLGGEAPGVACGVGPDAPVGDKGREGVVEEDVAPLHMPHRPPHSSAGLHHRSPRAAAALQLRNASVVDIVEAASIPAAVVSPLLPYFVIFILELHHLEALHVT